jgi:hypothetical protein
MTIMQCMRELVVALVSDSIKLNRGIIITIRQFRVRRGELLDHADGLKATLADTLDLSVLPVDLRLDQRPNNLRDAPAFPASDGAEGLMLLRFQQQLCTVKHRPDPGRRCKQWYIISYIRAAVEALAELPAGSA